MEDYQDWNKAVEKFNGYTQNSLKMACNRF